MSSVGILCVCMDIEVDLSLCCLQFQVASNYFGHLYLTELLKDKLVSSAPSRIVFTTSAAETYGSINWENLE